MGFSLDLPNFVVWSCRGDAADGAPAISGPGTKGGQEDFVSTNQDLADILGDTDFDFDSLYVVVSLIQNI